MEFKFCPITGQMIENLERKQEINYSINFMGKELNFSFCKKCCEKIPFDDIRHILRGLILNNRLEEIQTKTIHWDSEIDGEYDLKKELGAANYPRTAKDKADNLINELFKLQKYDGEIVDLRPYMSAGFNYFFFKNTNEFIFYLNTLEKQGEIQIRRDGGSETHYNFTFQGIINYIKRNSEGFNSKQCFIAMAFQPGMEKVRAAIKNAIIKTGFEPILVDEKNIESDRTINDEIIVSLKKCKFCVADFSYHKNGVYFESGFALGQGKHVIYLCEEKQFKDAHFDIRPLQHIIYKTPEELEDSLVAKIEAWIK